MNAKYILSMWVGSVRYAWKWLATTHCGGKRRSRWSVTKKQFQKRIWKKSTSYSNTQLLTQLVNVIKSFFSSTGQASHQCTVCFKIFSRCWDSQHHQSQEHSETDVHAELGYQCKMCSQLFKTPKTLKRHSSLNCVALSQNMSEIVAMKYRCEWCYRLMESEKSLKSHIDTHRALIRRLSKNQQTTETATSTITKPSTLSSSESSSLASCSRVPAAAATTRTSEIWTFNKVMRPKGSFNCHTSLKHSYWQIWHEVLFVSLSSQSPVPGFLIRNNNTL